MEEHKARYLEAWDQASEQGPLGGLVGGAAAVGDLKIMWDELADVAPEEIRSDAEAVRDAWNQQEEAAKNGDWLGALAGGLLNSGSMGRVDQYVRENCDGQAAVAAEAVNEPESAPVEPDSGTPDTPTPEPSPTPADLSGVQEVGSRSWASINGVLVQSSGLGAGDARGHEGPTDFYLPGEGLVEIDGSELLPGEELMSERWTVAGPASEPYAVGRLEIRQPAQGLDPEAYHTRLLAVRLVPGAPEIEQDTEIQSSPCTSNSPVVGSDTDAVAFALTVHQDGLSCQDDSTSIVAWDPRTGEELWEQQAEMDSWSHGVVTATYPDPEGQPWSRCLIVSGLDVPTGDPLWGIDEREHMQDDYCPGAGVDPGGGDRYATRISVNGDQGFTKWFETRTGRELSIPTALDHHDPVSGLGVVIGDGYTEDVPPGLTVLEPVTGEAVYRMDLDRFQSLGLQIYSFYDGRLYAGDGRRDLVIDGHTGDVQLEREQDDRPSSLTEFAYPVAKAGTHILFNTGVLVPVEDVDTYVETGAAAKSSPEPSSAA